jgi:dipeptidyl aminopeptidase/acylaminoacyl peptidase
MTTPTRLERNLPGILGDLSTAPTPEYLDDVFVRTGRMRQRPAWTFPGRWLPVAEITRPRALSFAPPWRLIALALVVLALLAAALVYLGAQQRRVPAPFGPARNGEIVYDSAGDIYAGNPETGATRLLVGGPEVDSAPGWSPDGTKMAFVRDVAFGVDLYVVREDGSDLRKVTSAPIADDAWANWTPDSRHLAVIGGAAGPGRLELLDVEGREAPRQLAPAMDVANPVFRPPDGREVAFKATVDGKLGLFVMSADGSDIRPLLEPNVSLEMGNHASNLVYSPDGTRLFYQSYVPASDGIAEGCCQLWVMNADGTDPHAFEQNRNAWSGVPTVSPDGRWVSYWYVFGDQPTLQVKVAAADGRGPAITTGPVMSDFFPWMWAPDSSKILMMPEDGSTTSAYLIDPAGGPYSTVPWQSGVGLDWQRLAE